MTRTVRSTLLAAGLLAASLGAAACGSVGVEVAGKDKQGAEIFAQKCQGCHSLDSAGAQGSADVSNIAGREYKDGPNFNQRAETYAQVVYAIQNGGYSSGPMPQNIVSGEEAHLVACYVSAASGKEAARVVAPKPPPAGAEAEAASAGAKYNQKACPK